MSVTAVPIPPVKSSYKIWLWLGILVAVAAAFALAWTGTRPIAAARGTDAEFLEWNKSQFGIQTTASGLQYQRLKGGTGETAKDGDLATVKLEGRLRDGKVFQPEVEPQIPVQSFDPTRPVAIPGFLEALKLMKKGSRYRFWLPANLAYGAIPGGGPPELADKMLIFDMEMSALVPASEAELQRKAEQEAMRRQLEAQGALPPSDGPPGE